MRTNAGNLHSVAYSYIIGDFLRIFEMYHLHQANRESRGLSPSYLLVFRAFYTHKNTFTKAGVNMLTLILLYK
jgi:hypothetical protein